MRLTPMEIQQKEFARALRGYSTRDVRNFLEVVASVFAELTADYNRLREELKRREAELGEHREREQNLRETILMAQKVADDLRKGASREAELMTAEASLRADEIIKGAHQRMTELQRQIQDFKRQRLQAEQELKSVLEIHMKMLNIELDANKKTDDSEAKLVYMSAEPKPKK